MSDSKNFHANFYFVSFTIWTHNSRVQLFESLRYNSVGDELSHERGLTANYVGTLSSAKNHQLQATFEPKCIRCTFAYELKTWLYMERIRYLQGSKRLCSVKCNAVQNEKIHFTRYRAVAIRMHFPMRFTVEKD